MRVAITGANGNLGKRLLRALDGVADVLAIVRSEAAREQLQGVVDERSIAVLDYGDEDALSAALVDCDWFVHLVGIIKETARSTYVAAHEDACRALGAAAHRAGVKGGVCLSIVGANPAASSECLRSRAAAEKLLLDRIPSVILRVPMVLGEDDYASRALARRAAATRSFAFRPESLEQPIYAGDVVSALITLLVRAEEAGSLAPRVIELAGPESLSRRTLIERAAAAAGSETRVVSLPLGLGLVVGSVAGALLKNPPVTADMLRVLDHDDHLDPTAAARELGLELTTVETMLGQVIGTTS